MPLNFITGNQYKFDQINDVLGNLVKLPADLVEIQSLDPTEIIRTKIRDAFNYHPGPFIVEDTSLCLDGLNGLPGPLIKWFLEKLKPEGIAELCHQSGNNLAKATSVIGYAKDKDNVYFFEDTMSGQIIFSPRGDLNLGWETIFQPDDMSQTLGEIDRKTKSMVMMRAKAARKLKEYLEISKN